MKEGIHPEYRPVVFRDNAANHDFLIRSTARTKDKIKWKDGNEYPLFNLDTSSISHPFYTGKHKVIDSGGQVGKFKKRYAAKAPAKAAEKTA